MIFPDNLSKKEIKLGFCYLAVSLLVLPSLLQFLPLGSGQQNFIYYGLNFAATLLIFHRFLWNSLQTALSRPFPTLYYGVLGYLGQAAIGEILIMVFLMLVPGFANVNDLSIALMVREDPYLMAIGTILLVPVVEECFYRGLIFRNLYDRTPVLAYIISIAVFSVIHVVGFVGTFEPLQLLLCFIQYIPAGYCLCFAYRRSGTIISPILLHTIVNALGVYNAVR